MWRVVGRHADMSGLPDAQRFPWSLPSKPDIPAVLHLPRAGSPISRLAEHGRDESADTACRPCSACWRPCPPARCDSPSSTCRWDRVSPLHASGRSRDAHILEKVWTEPRHIEQQLTDLTEHMENVIQTYLRNEYETIDEYNLPPVKSPNRTATLSSPISGQSERNRRQGLTSIMQAGARCLHPHRLRHPTEHAPRHHAG